MTRAGSATRPIKVSARAARRRSAASCFRRTGSASSSTPFVSFASSAESPLIAQATLDDWTLISNLGWVQDPVVGERNSLPYATASAVWQARDDLKLSAELGTFRSPDPSRGWQALTRFGVIVSLASWLDIDAGYQLRLNKDAPVRVILAGATLRW